MGLGKVLLDSISALVKVADLLFGLREILIGRFAIPIKGLLVIMLDAKTILEHAAYIVLPERIARLRRGTIVGQGALVILRHTELMLIHVAKEILCRSEALVSGLVIPEQSLAVVLGNADAIEIVVRQGELRLRVTGTGLRAKSSKIVVLRRGRGRFLRSRPRRGNQREHKESCQRGPGQKAHGHLPPGRISEKLTRKDATGNGAFLTHATRPAAAFCRNSIPPQSTATFQ